MPPIVAFRTAHRCFFAERLCRDGHRAAGAVVDRGRFVEVQELAAISVLAAPIVFEIRTDLGLVVLIELCPAAQLLIGVGEGALRIGGEVRAG